jgi:hypothetical protein
VRKGDIAIIVLSHHFCRGRTKRL